MEDRYKLILAPKAAHDLRVVFGHVAADSEAAAPAVIGGILQELDSLKLFPKRNVVPGQGGMTTPVRSLPIRPYVVFFRVNEVSKAVRILRVRHGADDHSADSTDVRRHAIIPQSSSLSSAAYTPRDD